MDNFYTGQINNVKHLTNHSCFQLVRHDVIIPFYHEDDEIYNLAAQSHVRVSFDIPEYTADITALGALRILESLRILNLKKTSTFVT